MANLISSATSTANLSGKEKEIIFTDVSASKALYCATQWENFCEKLSEVKFSEKQESAIKLYFDSLNPPSVEKEVSVSNALQFVKSQAKKDNRQQKVLAFIGRANGPVTAENVFNAVPELVSKTNAYQFLEKMVLGQKLYKPSRGQFTFSAKEAEYYRNNPHLLVEASGG